MRLTNAQAASRLNNFPRRILYQILDIVYSETNTSLSTLNNSRPEIPYEKIREISFEHRIINTKVLRSICRVFNAWALEEILFERPVEGKEVRRTEIDCSNFGKLMVASGSDNVVFERLVTAFPNIAASEVVIYLEDPIQILLPYALQSPESLAFSSFSFRDRKCDDSMKYLGWPLKALRKRERLEVYMAVCCGIFEGVDDSVEDAPRVRNWVIRGSQESSPCFQHRDPPSNSQVKGLRDHIEPVALRPDWGAVGIGKLMESCRHLRTRYEEKTQQKAAWNIEIHLSVLLGDVFSRHVHDMIFKPLERPPIAVLNRCHQGECYERSCLEEEWMDVEDESLGYPTNHMMIFGNACPVLPVSELGQSISMAIYTKNVNWFIPSRVASEHPRAA